MYCMYGVKTLNWYTGLISKVSDVYTIGCMGDGLDKRYKLEEFVLLICSRVYTYILLAQRTIRQAELYTYMCCHSGLCAGLRLTVM